MAFKIVCYENLLSLSLTSRVDIRLYGHHAER